MATTYSAWAARSREWRWRGRSEHDREQERAAYARGLTAEASPYSEADIAELLPLIGTREVAATTLRIAHPYTEQDARDFLALAREPGRIWLAITLRSDGRQIGGVGLRVDDQNQHAELGYWLGVPYWGQGYATEAAREMLRYGFEDLDLHRIFASHFKHNPASGRILVKLGMRYEGCQREHLRKWDEFVDSELYGMLRQDWQASGSGPV